MGISSVLLITFLIQSTESFAAVPRQNNVARLTTSDPKVLPIRGGGFAAPTFASQENALVRKMSSAAADIPAGGGEASVGGGTATIPNEIFNLVKNIVGAGVLSLPAGVAAFGNAPSAVIPATLLIATIGGLSAYCFSLIGRVCAYTGSTSYRGAWEKTVSEKSSWLPAFTCTFKTSTAVLAYSMILADTFKALIATAGYTVTRTQSLFGITGIVILPLCLLKNLASLAPFSLLGIIGMGYTTISMAIRYFGGAYALPAGRFLADLSENLLPVFGTTGAGGIFSPNSFILICMLSTAYMAHFNAPKFYIELKDNTIPRYNKVVYSSFSAAIAIFASVANLGFLTFGSNANGLILNNYSTKDALASFTRIAVAISIVFSYPLAFAGLRDGVFDLANIAPQERTNPLVNKVTLGLLSIVTGLALVVKDLAFVLSFGGATLGNALIYIYPFLMFKGAVEKMKEPSDGLKKEVGFSMAVAAMGTVFGMIGSTMAIKSIL